MTHNTLIIKAGLAAALTLINIVPTRAQSDQFGFAVSGEVKKKLASGLDATFEGELRTTDAFGAVERWSLSPGLSYRFTPWLKADAAYTYIYRRVEGETTRKGNYVPAYWSPRHRFTASLTGSVKLGRFELSLRERYQFTHRRALSVPKYDGDDGSRKDDEQVSAKNEHMLRSRAEVAYDIRRSPFTPYASVETYNDLAGSLSLDKTRFTLGTEIKLAKRHTLDVYYRFQDHADDDEANGHLVGVGYKFKF